MGIYTFTLSLGKDLSSADISQLFILEAVNPSYLAHVDAIVDRPGRLETFHHALLQGLWQSVHTDKILQVLGAGVVEGATRVHPLDDGGHITKHHSVH